MLEQHLKRLESELQLPPFPQKDKTSSYTLLLAGDLAVSIKSLRQGIALFANVAPVPTQKKEEAFIHFMKANMLGQGTGAQALGLDPEEKFLTLSCIIPYDMDYKEFKEKIEDFANYLDYWRSETDKLEKASQESIL